MPLPSSPSRRYELADIDAGEVEMLSASLGLSRITAACLVARGVETEEEARAFLSPDLKRDCHDPRAIPGLEDVAARVSRAIRNHEKIMVFGDFDVDGISSSAALVSALRELGADPSCIIPLRLEEGYGLSEASLRRVLADAPDLLVTVDNGIASAAEAEQLIHAGVDVCITDHHEPGSLVPGGIPVADPKLDRNCPSFGLAGVGVAIKLIALLGEMLGHPGMEESFLDFAALGTLADQMPLTGENRAIVTAGVQLMNESPRPAMRAYQARSTRKDPLSSEGLSFGLIPRINSAGRMGDPTVALDFLLSQSDAEAFALMDRLEGANNARREVESNLDEEVSAAIERDYKGGRGIVEWGEGWHDGVKGIVASRIVGRFGVPVILFSVHDGLAYGSGRTAGSVDLFEAVGSCEDMLVRFGGHAAAVGVTVEAGRLEEFRQRFCAVLDALPEEAFEKTSRVDCDASLGEVGIGLVDELSRLEPYGQDNPAPCLVARSVYMVDRRAIGNPAVHFSCTATDGCNEVRGIFFRPDELSALVSCEDPVDIVFSPQQNEFRGHVSAQLMISDILPAEAGALQVASDAALELVESLFSRSSEFLDRGDYAGILDADSFHTKVAGVSFEERQALLARMSDGEKLFLAREPGNAFDANAIAVMSESGQLGYLNARLAIKLAPAMDAGAAWDVVLSEVTGKWDGKSLGANITVSKHGLQVEDGHDGSQRLKRRREMLSGGDGALRTRIKEALIGNHDLHDAQKRSLDLLSQGKSVLCIMVTGRGKSLIFHMNAALLALSQGAASIFVFPLRALVADQAYHLQQTFGKIGVNAVLLTGESSADERDDVFSGLSSGSVDCVLTTPEFLSIHAAQFAQSGRVKFLVIDEAHHIAEASGHRPAYALLPQVLQTLSNPTVLATTATAGDDVAAQIRKALSIEDVVVDETVRENLRMHDLRDASQRDIALARICSGGDKTVVYVNSRDQATSIARDLRRKAGNAGGTVAFYHAGLPRADRAAVEDALRSGELTCIVSTSAFGEGVDIADIRNVVLYHLPFNDVEFNQMSGRAGRDGQEATVHLLYERGDARINEKILSSAAPPRSDLAALYRVCRSLSRAARDGADVASDQPGAGEGYFQSTNEDLASLCHDADPKCHIDEHAVSAGISVFKELGLVTTAGHGSARRIAVADGKSKVELEQSSRYLEGQDEIEEFAHFKDWALTAPTDELLARINRPIAPTR